MSGEKEKATYPDVEEGLKQSPQRRITRRRKTTMKTKIMKLILNIRLSKSKRQHDSLSDGVEDANENGAVDLDEPDPLDADTDDDGVADGDEPSWDVDTVIMAIKNFK
jgi:hypothetical protein